MPVSQVLTGIFFVVASVMAEKWRIKVAKSITVTNTKYPYKEPFLSKPGDNDLSKQWVVEYGVWSETDKEIKRKRVTITGDTVRERTDEAANIIKELKALLKRGVCVDPVGEAKPAVPKRDPNRVEPNTLVSVAIERWLTYKKQTVSRNSYRTYKTSIDVLSRYIREEGGKRKTLSTFGPGDALEFMDATVMIYGQSNRSHNNIRDVCHMFYKHWCDRINKAAMRVVLTNPFDDIGEKVTKSRKHIPYNERQKEALKKEMIKQEETYLLLFVQFIYYTFMRPHEEVRLLRVRDIKKDTIWVNYDTAKDNEAEHVEIPPPLQRLIEEHKLREYPDHYYIFSRDGKPGEKPVGKTFFWRRHRTVLDTLQYTDKPYDLYSYKHTGVIDLWNATQNIKLIQQHCRHSSVAETETYMRDLGIIVRFTQIQDFPEF